MREEKLPEKFSRSDTSKDERLVQLDEKTDIVMPPSPLLRRIQANINSEKRIGRMDAASSETFESGLEETFESCMDSLAEGLYMSGGLGPQLLRQQQRRSDEGLEKWRSSREVPVVQTEKLQSRMRVVTLEERLVDDRLLREEVRMDCPEILATPHISRFSQVYRRHRLAGYNQCDVSLRDSGQPKLGYELPEGDSKLVAVAGTFFNPLNAIAMPPCLVTSRSAGRIAHRGSMAHAKRLPGSPLAETVPTAVVPPSLLKALPVPASRFFDWFDVKRIGPYLLTKSLGTGSTSKVKLGVHETNGSKLAIKIVPREPVQANAGHPSVTNHVVRPANSNMMPNPSTAMPKHGTSKSGGGWQAVLIKEARLLREMTVMSLLHHPHIATLYGHSETPGCFILYMEYVAGGPLLHYIVKHGKLSESHARHFFRQLLSAVAYLHANAIVHRDLKIENVLIDADGNLKLIDFGLSNFYAPPKRDFSDPRYSSKLPLSPNSATPLPSSAAPLPALKLKTFCGSLYYAAPELLHGRPYHGPEIDIWSLGVILYVLVTGKVPFDDAKLSVLHEKIKCGQVSYPQYLSKELTSLLRSMLVVDPKERAPLLSIVNHPWVTTGPVTPHLVSAKEGNDAAAAASTPVSTNPTPVPALSPEAIPHSDSPAHISPVPLYLPDRLRLITIDPAIVLGICMALRQQYSPALLCRLLEHILLDWDAFSTHPLICLYFLVEEKVARHRIDRDALRYLPHYKRGTNLVKRIYKPDKNNINSSVDSWRLPLQEQSSAADFKLENSSRWSSAMDSSAVHKIAHAIVPPHSSFLQKDKLSLPDNVKQKSPFAQQNSSHLLRGNAAPLYSPKALTPPASSTFRLSEEEDNLGLYQHGHILPVEAIPFSYAYFLTSTPTNPSSLPRHAAGFPPKRQTVAGSWFRSFLQAFGRRGE
jgi:serine/threonine protein kinase